MHNDDTVSFEASTRCPRCGSSNWLKKENDNELPHAPQGMLVGQLVCNDCGTVWSG